MCVCVCTDPLKNFIGPFSGPFSFKYPPGTNLWGVCVRGAGSFLVPACEGMRWQGIDEDASLCKNLAAGLKEACLRFAGLDFPFTLTSAFPRS